MCVFCGRCIAGNRPVTFVSTVEADRWHEEAGQLVLCILADKNEVVWNYGRWGKKNSFFNLTPAGKDNTILSAQKCCGLMSCHLWYLLLYHIGFVVSWTGIIHTFPNHIHRERKTMWRPDIFKAVLPNILVLWDLTQCHWLSGAWRSAVTQWYRHRRSTCHTRCSNSLWTDLHWRCRQYRPSKRRKPVTWQHSIVPRTWMLQRKPTHKIRFA
jgi:hypothetical protein